MRNDLIFFSLKGYSLDFSDKMMVKEMSRKSRLGFIVIFHGEKELALIVRCENIRQTLVAE